MKKFFCFILSASLFLTFQSCNISCTEGTGTVKTERRPLASFTRLLIEIPAEVTILKGQESMVTIEAQENILAKIKTSVSSNRLRIDEVNCLKSAEPIKITVFLTELEELKVTGSANITIPDTLTVKNINLEVTGSGDINGKFIAASIEAETTGSGDIVLAGSANKQVIRILGSGNVDAIKMPCNSSTVKVTGSGDVYVYAIESLDIKVNGSGTVHYKGKPSLNTSVNGSGKVKDEN